MMEEKVNNVFVFLPNTLKSEKVGLLEGFSVRHSDYVALFVLNDELQTITSDCIGYVSENSPEKLTTFTKDCEWIHINAGSGEIRLNNIRADDTYNTTCIVYDYDIFSKSEALDVCYKNYGDCFQTLINALQQRKLKSKIETRQFSRINFLIIYTVAIYLGLSLKFTNLVKPLINYSAVLSQFQESTMVSQWILTSIRQEKRITMKRANVLVSKALDVILGLLVLFCVIKYEDDIANFMLYSTKAIIVSIQKLLVILMGSPVGLKLNYAFSQNLGRFFLYHISLWEAFLEISQSLLQHSFKLLIIPGSLGLTYQIALLTDLFAFTTFHVYCIYVYAARLYGLQFKGLVSLSKLFIGKKQNPLRERVDSLQYTHNQLFIGTLGFTVLLFLLPTTLLYYSVFTVLRLLLMALNAVLLRIRYVLQCLPFYILYLRITKSPKIAGGICLDIDNNSKNLKLYATLKTSPLPASIKGSFPEVLSSPSKIEWGKIVCGAFTGVLL